jgi:HKD family nuclease
MTEEQYILKERVRLLIGEARVKAALFYTFNFDPKFFENYVMPLLVPEQQFVNNNIINNIIWRKLYKDNLVPPITVYCDLYAKSADNGPMLSYQVVSVNMPSVGLNKGNFHPKHSFILIEKDNGDEALIVITGSNNLTQGGWCENIECISEHVLINNRFFPYQFKKDVQAFLVQVLNTYNKSSSEAEDLIYNFLNGRGTTADKSFVFYDSFQMSFFDFLDAYVFDDAFVDEVEVISPFFKNDTALVKYFTDKGVKVKIEAPFLQDYCLLEEQLYTAYEEAGVTWYRNVEGRAGHSKVYRFYGKNKVYTIIGSVNFTAPAWRGISDRSREIYNIESAVLYWESQEKRTYFLKNKIKREHLTFLPHDESLENRFEERVNAPSLDFVINWQTKKLSWKGRLQYPCYLHLTGDEQLYLNDSKEQYLLTLKHGQQIVDSLARQPILKVIEKTPAGNRQHYYYPNQEGYEYKPIEYRLSATDIIDAWDLLGAEDKELNEWLLNRLELYVELAQDESGKLKQEVTEGKSLLNEMARHMYGLIKLESFLFDPSILNKSGRQKTAHSNNIRYYLTYDNVDTLHSYLKDIEKLYSDGKLLGGYYWLLLTLVQTKFYAHPLLPKLFREVITDDTRKALKEQIEEQRISLEQKLSLVQKELEVDDKKLKWAVQMLMPNEQHA